MSFGTPRAIAINFTVIVAFLAAWPTDRLGYVPVRSLWENVFGFRPYSSGMMRSLSLILHGEFGAAWDMNPLGFAALPLIIGLVVVNAARWRRLQIAGRVQPPPAKS